MKSNWQKTVDCISLGCGIGAGTCFIANAIDAEIGFAPCYVGACGGVIIGCAVAGALGML